MVARCILTMLKLFAYRIYKVLVMLASICIFTQGSLSIVLFQGIVNSFYRVDLRKKQKYMNLTKKRFILLLVTILSIVAPSRVRITTDNESISKNTVYLDREKGRLISKAHKRAVVIANHQIYTDWVFLWWLAYISEVGGNVHIMLKKSLESIPLLGRGMRNYKFIFMKRKWDHDRVNLTNILQEIDLDSRGLGKIAGNLPTHVTMDGEQIWDESKNEEDTCVWPYWLILFPEGTNLSAGTRIKAEAFAKKTGISPFKHVLLPRVTGLRFCLQKLRKSCECVYDVTIAYSGIKPDQYGQDIYKLSNIFLKGESPKMVDIYVRAIKLDDIPMDDDDKFQKWIFQVWKHKDDLLENYYRDGTFGLDPDLNSSIIGPCKVSTLSIFSILILPVLTLMLLVYIVIKKFLN